MAEIPPTLPGSQLPAQALSLPLTGLPPELVASLESGETLAAKVLAQLSADRYLLQLAGREVMVESRLSLSPGDELMFAARQSGAKWLLDLLPAEASVNQGVRTSAPASQPPASMAPAGQPAATMPQAEPQPAAEAPRTLVAGIQSALGRGAPLGELVAQAIRALGASVPSESPAPAPASQPPVAPGLPPAGEAVPVPARPGPALTASASAPVFMPTPGPIPAGRPASQAPAVQVPTAPATPATPAAPAAPAAEPQPAAAVLAAPAATALPAPVAREIIQILREVFLQILPPAATGEAALAPNQPEPRAAAAPPPALPATPGGAPAPATAPESAGLAAPLPTPAAVAERIAAALSALESAAAEYVARLPGATALGALLAALDSLPAPAAGAAAVPAAANLAALTAADGRGAPPVLTPELRAELAPVLERVLGAVARGASPERAVREALAPLDDRQRLALRALAAEREHALVAAAPQLEALGSAHRSLSAAQERLDLGKLWNLAAEQPGQSFSYVELPALCGDQSGTARLKVLVRRAGSEGQGAGGGGSPKSTRAVLDLSMSALGGVWTELTLAGQNLAVRMELADADKSAFVAAHLGELREQLGSGGLYVQAAAGVRPARRKAPADSEDAGAARGGLDLWA